MDFSLNRVGNMAFHGKTPSGHDVYMDAREVSGGNDSAPTPMELLLAALMGCTSMDVVSILKKMKLEDYEYRTKVNFKKAVEHPKIYTDIELVYIFKGKNLPKEKIEKAVTLSQEKYCSVSAMIRPNTNITHRIEYEEE